jgi:S-adenosylmethionine synthetase
MAKTLVKPGLSKRALVKLSYAIVVAMPLSLSVVTSDAECNKLTTYDITNIVMIEFDGRQGAIVFLNGMRDSDQEQRGHGCWRNCQQGQAGL